MKCEACGHNNAENALYCEECGEPFGESPRLHAIPLKRLVSPEMLNRITFFIRGEKDPFTIKVDNPLLVGRSDAEYSSSEPPDVDLAPYDAQAKGVSRRHLRIERKDGALLVEDLDSKNGTFLNGQRVPPQMPRNARYGDRLRLGQLVIHLTFEIGDDDDFAE